jgi:hypothetical protein
MITKNIQLIQYDSQEITFQIEKEFLSSNSKVFLQYKKSPIDSAVCSLEITPGDAGNDWFPSIGNYSTIQWNVLPEHTLTKINKITRFGYGLLLIDGVKRKTLSNGNILMFPSYNSPWIVKENYNRIEKEILYSTIEEQTIFETTNIILSDELLVFADGLLTEDYTRLNDTSIQLLPLPINTQVVIYSIVKTSQEMPIIDSMLDLVDKAILKSVIDNQTDFTTTFNLANKEYLSIFVDSLLVEDFERLNDTTIRLTNPIPINTQIVILSPKTTGAILKPIEQKQIIDSNGNVQVFTVNPSTDISGYFKYFEYQILESIFDGQTEFEITDFVLSNNLIVFNNFLVTKDYTVNNNTIVLNQGVTIGTKVIVYSIR